MSGVIVMSKEMRQTLLDIETDSQSASVMSDQECYSSPVTSVTSSSSSSSNVTSSGLLQV